MFDQAEIDNMCPRDRCGGLLSHQWPDRAGRSCGSQSILSRKKGVAQWGEGSGVSRRRFFQLLLRDVVVAGEKLRGQQHFRLIDLPKFSDEDLSRIIPRLIEERSYWIDQDAFWTDDGVGGALRISDASPVERFLLDCFRGVESIAEIAQRLAYHFDFDEPEAFRRTRGFFLLLAVGGLCAPANTSLWSTVEEPAASEDPGSLAEHNRRELPDG